MKTLQSLLSAGVGREVSTENGSLGHVSLGFGLRLGVYLYIQVADEWSTTVMCTSLTFSSEDFSIFQN